MSVADEFALARHADLWDEYLRCAQFVAERGAVYMVRGPRGPSGEEGRPICLRLYPQAKQKLALADALLRIEQEYGLTPAARASLLADRRTRALGRFPCPRFP